MKQLQLAVMLQLIALGLSAQVNISIQPPQETDVKAKELFAVALDNPTNQQRQVQLQATLADPGSGAVLASFHTAGFPMPMGYSNLNPRQLTITRTRFQSKELQQFYRNTGTIKGGRYELRINVIDLSGNREIAQSVRTIQIESSGKQKQKARKKIDFRGNGYVETHVSNRKGYQSQVPRQYVRASLQPSLTLGPVPVSMDMFYTSEENQAYQEMNTLAFHFDEDRFVSNMRNRLTSAVMEKVGVEGTNMQGKLKRFEALKRTLNDPNIKGKVKQLDQLESIEAKLENKDLIQAAEQAGNLKQKVETRAKTFRYDAQKQKINAQISAYEAVSYTDPQREANRKHKLDSLQNALSALDAKRDSIKTANQQDMKRLQQLKEKQQQYKKLKARYEQLQQIKKLKSQLDMLREEYKSLESLAEKIDQPAPGKLSQYKEMLSGDRPDKQMLKEELLQKGLLNKGESLLMGIDQLSAGTIYPSYSPLTLNGIRAQGGQLAFNPGLFYLNVAGGISSQPVPARDSLPGQFKQQFVAGKIGMGKAHRSHFYLTGLRSRDQGSSIKTIDSLFNSPQANTIVGVELQLTFADRNVRLKGELAGSKLDSDTRLEALEAGTERIPGFLKPTIGSNYGYAYDVEAEFRLFQDNTNLLASAKTIDPAYSSFGAPFLRNDIQRYEVKLKQFLFERQIQLSGEYRNDRDNLIWDTGDGMKATHLSGRMAFRFQNWPHFRLQYMEQDQDMPDRNFLSKNFSANAGYGYSIKNLQLSTNFNYNSRQGRASDSLGDFSMNQLMVNQMVSFQKPLSLNFNVSYTNNQNAQQDYTRLSVDAGANATLFKKLNVSAGLRLNSRFDKSSRTGIYAEVNYPFLEYFSFNMRFDNRYYDDLIYPGRSFDELILKTRLTVNW